MGARREPERTCVACRRTAGKRELLRIVRTPPGDVRVDPTGTAPGRGAYVHRDPACVRTALRRGARALARALRTGLPAEEAARLGREIERELEA
ncbi:MAG: hypothetical protein KatS3mg014_1818 [Actinomycetota bacterium]|nr:MAG: hypothetical protein KatS3mg014_1818 [Actinomycetota bacterium]